MSEDTFEHSPDSTMLKSPGIDVSRPATDGKVAILLWGDVIEDFLEPIGKDLRSSKTDILSGGWVLGYVEALRQAGLGAVIACVSRTVRRPERRAPATGSAAPVWLLPSPRRYQAVRTGLQAGPPWTTRPVIRQGLSTVAPYLSTPLRALSQMLRTERCTALLCQEYEEPRFDLCVVLGRVLRLPVFATFQGGAEPKPLQSIRRWSIRTCSGLIVAPAAEAQRVSDRYGVDSARIARIPNALDADEFREPSRTTARRLLGVPSGARVVAWHGRADLHNKGLDVLIDAWAQVCAERRGHDLRLLMVGGGPDADEVRRRLHATQLENVHWHDEYVTDRTLVRTHLRAADVYAFPSRREGFPVAPLEAMACGLPVVAANALGTAEILGDENRKRGYLVPVGDARAFARVLGRALDDPSSTRAAGRIAREHVAAHFSFEAVGKALRQLVDADG